MLHHSMRPTTSNQDRDAETTQMMRDEARIEADRLRKEISQSATELQRLEKLSQQVRQGGYKRSVTPPPLQPSKTTRPASSTNGLEARVPSQGSLRSPTTNGARSSSTGKLIEHLQHEMSGLKLTAESYRRQFESEKGAREALKVKYDDIEGTLSTARVESRSHALSLARSDKALSAAIAEQGRLAGRLKEEEAARQAIEEARQGDVTAIEALKEAIVKEKAMREQVEQEHAVLADHHRRFKEENLVQLAALQEQFAALRKDLVGDASSQKGVQQAQSELAALRTEQAAQLVVIKADRSALAVAREEEARILHETVRQLEEEVARVTAEMEARTGTLEELQGQWEQMKQKAFARSAG
ncbi:hypothetical protein BCR37DRAFT_20926 [Protomyces lactucae-debilis]|uniref:SWI5-dependent HO expression protein 3 n=1 Tax=Protomyces lactucae-debilis TaxID=2754530 RepID=A0A1Y2FD87_PROLT|nr:uncharacterized protein BCR37DRAFT_20926 [Protomyces lactucae-debilis]ORY81892.1 hypothetical protein BCR37DRAFT_20926 [Protomyces lactucae-debilis]